MSAKTNLFFGGVPTAPDVKKLDEAIGLPSEGMLIQYEKLESIIGCGRDASRYATVVHAWRKRLWNEHNLLLIAVEGEGLKVANPAERVETAAKKAKHGKRAIMVASVIALRTEPERLTAPQRETRAWLADVPSRLRLAEQVAPKPVRRIG